MKRTCVALGLGLLPLILFLVFSRLSLLFLFLPIAIVLMLSRWLWQRSFKKVAIFVAGFLVLMIAIPVDIEFRKVGHFSMKQIPIVWGLPTRNTLKLVDKGELMVGGCVVPFHPARSVIVITF